MNVGVVIPAYNEESSIGTVVRRVIATLDRQHPFRIVVCDNGSEDGTAGAAATAGAEVRAVSKRGYGAACMGGIERLGGWPAAIVFLDADGSSLPEEIPRLLRPMQDGEFDLVLGSRTNKTHMTLPQRWGTALAVWLVNVRWGGEFSDMGPFRAIRTECLRELGVKDQTWGWTLEMQILALLRGLRIQEVEVSWEPRIAGVSKISGTVSGVVRAGCRILWTFALHAPKRARRRGGTGAQYLG